MRQLFIFLGMTCALYGMGQYVNGTIYENSGSTLPGVTVTVKGSSIGATSDQNGFYSIKVPSQKSILVFSYIGYQTQEVEVKGRKILDITMQYALEDELQEVVVTGYARAEKCAHRILAKDFASSGAAPSPLYLTPREEVPNFNTEEYATIQENGFRKVLDKPLSTFSIDVDAASYSNMRRYIHGGQLPPKDAIRIEEMINYFNYEYENPKGKDPFSINTEVTSAPWNEDHLVVQVGLQGRRIETRNLPASNIVFLIDVSGSMNASNKLPLLKSAFKLLTNELRPQDKVAIAVYAGAAGLVLPPTSGEDKDKIMEALDQLQAGGSTAGGAGIQLAYNIAREQFIEGGNNRVILATDGDFN
ncbi:MAG: von Willebrand factor type A domain-containing protein, partial [Bacteroidota bacterium]